MLVPQYPVKQLWDLKWDLTTSPNRDCCCSYNGMNMCDDGRQCFSSSNMFMPLYEQQQCLFWLVVRHAVCLLTMLPVAGFKHNRAFVCQEMALCIYTAMIADGLYCLWQRRGRRCVVVNHSRLAAAALCNHSRLAAALCNHTWTPVPTKMTDFAEQQLSGSCRQTTSTSRLL